MRHFLTKHKITILLLFFISVGTLFRFYNLPWGAPYYFHPDERNIASAISQLSFPTHMNPHFFAYGSFPLYIVYGVGVFINIIQSIFRDGTTANSSVSFEQALLIGRILSATLSVGLIPLLYIIGKQLAGKTTGLIAAFFAATSIGFIQYAHFSTFEMWLTFFSTLLFYYSVLFLKKPQNNTLAFIALLFGILCGTKISSIILLLPILLLLFYAALHSQERFISKVRTFFISSLTFFLLSFLVFILSNPFILITPSEFLSSMQYESSVVLHTLPVFYTQGFTHTIPLVYQGMSIFPFLLNPFLLLLFIPSFIALVFLTVKQRSLSFGLLLLFFLLLFCSQGFFFAKWTRYMIPTLPFIYLIIAIFLSHLTKLPVYLSVLIRSTLFVLCMVYAVMFVYVVYHRQDSRVAAMEWANKYITHNQPILSEVYDLGIIPFNHHFSKITLVNFYDLEHDITEQQKLTAVRKNASIIILPSQRIIKTRIQHPKEFPKSFLFYNALYKEQGYKKIYHTPCDIFCKIVYMGDPIFSLEETTAVFDRPTVTIYKKI